MMTNWEKILRPGQRGLAVEGDDDKRIIEAFLDTGWPNWTQSLQVQPAGNFDKVLKDLVDPANQNIVWGLVDRDWRTEDEIAGLQAKYPQLLFLPRIMIDNFLIEPDALIGLLPPVQRAAIDEKAWHSEIEGNRAEWIKHGALSKVLYAKGAHDFCRGHSGYPRALIDTLITDEAEITAILGKWSEHLDPLLILSDYRKCTADFQKRTHNEHYRLCINGKTFFDQVIIQKVLNRFLGQASRSEWLSRLFRETPGTIPADLESVLRQLFS